jgi:glycerol kinase
VGYWKDQAEVSKQWQADRRFEPDMAVTAVEGLRANWRRALERSKAWAE